MSAAITIITRSRLRGAGFAAVAPDRLTSDAAARARTAATDELTKPAGPGSTGIFERTSCSEAEVERDVNLASDEVLAGRVSVGAGGRRRDVRERRGQKHERDDRSNPGTLSERASAAAQAVEHALARGLRLLRQLRFLQLLGLGGRPGGGGLVDGRDRARRRVSLALSPDRSVHLVAVRLLRHRPDMLGAGGRPPAGPGR